VAARNTRLLLGGRVCAPHRSHREIPSNRRRSKAANNASPRSRSSRSPKRTCAWEHRRAHMQGTHAPPTSKHTHTRTHIRTHARTRARTQNTCVGRPAGGCAPSALPETSRTTAQCPHCLGSSLARARNAPPHPHRPDASKQAWVDPRHAEQQSAQCGVYYGAPCARCGGRARRQTRRCLRRRTRRRCVTLWVGEQMIPRVIHDAAQFVTFMTSTPCTACASLSAETAHRTAGTPPRRRHSPCGPTRESCQNSAACVRLQLAAPPLVVGALPPLQPTRSQPSCGCVFAQWTACSKPMSSRTHVFE
jgi:hypothetical protein